MNIEGPVTMRYNNIVCQIILIIKYLNKYKSVQTIIFGFVDSDYILHPKSESLDRFN